MRNMIGAVFMIVKIFCAILVVLGVSRKKPAGDNTADDEDTFMYTNYMQGFYL